MFIVVWWKCIFVDCVFSSSFALHSEQANLMQLSSIQEPSLYLSRLNFAPFTIKRGKPFMIKTWNIFKDLQCRFWLRNSSTIKWENLQLRRQHTYLCHIYWKHENTTTHNCILIKNIEMLSMPLRIVLKMSWNQVFYFNGDLFLSCRSLMSMLPGEELSSSVGAWLHVNLDDDTHHRRKQGRTRVFF